MVNVSRSAFLRLTASAAIVAATGDGYARAAAARSTAVDRRAIVEVRVFKVDPDVETMVALDPGRFLGFPGLRTRTHRDRATIDAFLDALASTKPLDARYGIDTRYGLRFSSRHGIVEEAFFDPFFTTAVVDGRAVSPQSPGLLRAAFRKAIV